jgi:chromodomain-helicase-DNA-binding protein 7
MLRSHQGLKGPFLVVAPLSTVVNWQREISMWTDLDAVIYYGSQEDRGAIREYEFRYRSGHSNSSSSGSSSSRKISDGYKIDVIIASPETAVASDLAKSTGRMRRELSNIKWDVVVVDEAHKLKNFESKLSCCLRDEYDYANCLLLTGTPLQNSTGAP